MNSSIASPPAKGRSLKYLELADHFRQQVASGELRPGYQLPSFAQMQAVHGIGQGTLERVYVLLERDGLITRTPGRGTFVAEPKTRTAHGVIGILSEAMAHQHPYYTQVLRGIQDAAHQSGFSILLMSDSSAFDAAKMDGLIIHNTKQPSSVLLSQIPRVAIITERDGMPSVSSDDYDGTIQAVEHLLELGHRKIAFLTAGGQGNADAASKQRLKAYGDALNAVGISPAPRWVHSLFNPWNSDNADLSFAKGGYQKMSEWLEEGWPALGCTALLAQNDDTAIGAIQALEEAGIKVPEDVSVIGFDGVEAAAFRHPQLTTVEVPLQAMGKKAVELLRLLVEKPQSRLEHSYSASTQFVLPTRLRIGASTAMCLASTAQEMEFATSGGKI